MVFKDYLNHRWDAQVERLARELLHPAIVGLCGFTFRQIRFVWETFTYLFLQQMQFWVITEIQLK